MKKAKYEVHRNKTISAIYVTQTRNAEDMLQEIRKMHEKFDEWGNTYFYKIYQVVEGERTLIYTPKTRKFWDENLVV